MAIQLNDRDHFIFKLIDEHQVLLEKHISWFIAGNEKPVLIRDRLRKLFYLDYLLCHRHGTKLPWWTTPTKPLVYMLSPMTRTLLGMVPSQIDLLDTTLQRHLLEVANIRMMHLVAQKDGQIEQFSWLTCKHDATSKKILDAQTSFKCGDTLYSLAVINHPAVGQELAMELPIAIEQVGNIDRVLIVSRDEEHQQSLQQIIRNTDIGSRCFFTTHHELYRSGIIKCGWQTIEQTAVDLFGTGVDPQTWTDGMNEQSMSGAVA